MMNENEDHGRPGELAFEARRQDARVRIDQLTGANGGDTTDRQDWFRTVYSEAGNDAAAVPWAELAPKQALLDWLKDYPGNGATALDVACGLGDNAEALAEAGYATTAFDLAPEATGWAQKRFPNSLVSYQAADLFALPKSWNERFDLVHECYTLQALKDPLRRDSVEILSRLVSPGGRLLFINRSREEGSESSGPPWPMMPSEWRRFCDFGLSMTAERFYSVERLDRSIRHAIVEFRKDT